MNYRVARLVSTKGREENISSIVVFPYNEDDICYLFNIWLEYKGEIDEYLYFADNPGGQESLCEFNEIILGAEKTVKRINDFIEVMINDMKERACEVPKEEEDKGLFNSITLSRKDMIVWKYCMNSRYQSEDNDVRVYPEDDAICVYYDVREARRKGMI